MRRFSNTRRSLRNHAGDVRCRSGVEACGRACRVEPECRVARAGSLHSELALSKQQKILISIFSSRARSATGSRLTRFLGNRPPGWDRPCRRHALSRRTRPPWPSDILGRRVAVHHQHPFVVRPAPVEARTRNAAAPPRCACWPRSARRPARHVLGPIAVDEDRVGGVVSLTDERG